MSERYEAAKKRVESEYINILADTPENVSDSFDDCMYRLFR